VRVEEQVAGSREEAGTKLVGVLVVVVVSDETAAEGNATATRKRRRVGESRRVADGIDNFS
jgi:hypothetical protein